MPPVVIENPILNSPFEEPKSHWRFSNDGITNETVESRRISSYFVPIPPPKKKGKSAQLAFDTEWTQDREQENTFINRVRERVSQWRKGGYVGITRTTRRLLDYWQDPEREKKLFFCQIEAMETAIYLTEVVGKYGDSWIDNDIRRFSEDANPGLYRIAFKMATGSGKTVVMGMIIAWHVLNKQANPQDVRFCDTFLIVTPGITIRDRLRVLYPNDPDNYYRERDILPQYLMPDLHRVKLFITNFHAFKARELVKAGRLTKSILGNALTESPDQMVRRVCRELGNKKNIIVINDEAHHCYLRKQEADDDKLTGDDRKEAERREEKARVWISGLQAVKNRIGIKVIYDLSATPFFLRGSGYGEGKLFPWVVSDFALIDAIESGIVKVPRVPVSDDSMRSDLPTYRNIWIHIRDHLPKKGRRTEDALGSERRLPKELEGALHSLYGNYEKYYRLWEDDTEGRANGRTPPVFIVVCNNTSVSKLVYDYISGWKKQLAAGTEVIEFGNLPIFRNHDDYGSLLSSPNTILIDSEQLESGEAMSLEFKKMAAMAIEEFKHEYRLRFERDVEKLTDEDLLREVMNTVGKPGKLGENIKCVVSVSMLTEGWDASTVTHIMGVRAFGTQLLCEQVVGRALRRMSYAIGNDGRFDPEYAEVYGVPFSFIPCAGSQTTPKLGPTPTRVRALEERIDCEITFPRVEGYRYDFPEERLKYEFTGESVHSLSTYDVPTETELAPIIGETAYHDLSAFKLHREQAVAFHIAKLALERYFRDDHGNLKQWLFPQILTITRDWTRRCVKLKDHAFIQMLLIREEAHLAAEKIYQSIVSAEHGPGYLKPILRQYDNVGSTRHVDFTTTRPVYPTRPDKCHVTHVVADTESWEQKTAQAIEEMEETVCYVKNHGLSFTIPYAFEGEEKHYIPDYIVRLRVSSGDILNLILETSGEPRKDKAAKTAAARNLWVPAINNHGGFGRWAFLEVTDPWDAQNTIQAAIKSDVVLKAEE